MAEFDAKWVQVKVETLLDLVASEVELDEDETILDRVFDEDQVDYLDDHLSVLHGALNRLSNDYDKALDADAHLLQSQQALQAIADNMALRADADAPDDEDKAEPKPAARG